MPNPYASGTKILADDGNQSLPITLTAGETINGATLPVAVYMDDTDNELKACDGNDTATFEFIGFAISNSTDGNDITIQTKGIVDGFTGLDTGKKYYVHDDKTIGTTVGTYEVLVGIAISATQILIFKNEFQLAGTESLNATAVPEGTRMIIVALTVHDADGIIGEVVLMRNGKLTGTLALTNSQGPVTTTGTVTWDVGATTVTMSGQATAGTCYYYR